MKKNKLKGALLSQTQVIAIGFAIIILVGALLLMLPVSAKPGQTTTFLGALLTATSATCVTGLVSYDTYTHWSLFGKVIILLMIQTGGLGFMTINVLFLQLFKKNIGLKTRSLIKESISATQYGGVVKLVRVILKGTLLIEGIGAILLSIRFIPMLGFVEGVGYGIFHSISAFCNAGFDLMGRYGEYGSLCMFVDDPIVNIVLDILIVTGGIGFIVWSDVLENKHHFKKYKLHTKMVISTTAVLLIAGTFLFWLFERNNTLSEYGFCGQFFGALFDAVTPRTAGFNTTDTAALTNASKVLTMFLMLVGGSPGSTAGGIKTTTLLVIIVYVFSNLRNSVGCNIFGRRLDDDAIKKASLVIFIDLTMIIIAAVTIFGVQPELAMEEVLFEVFSAIGTAGMSTGVTRQLSDISRVVIIILMYTGRIGSMTFGMSFLEKKKKTPVMYPAEKITIG